MRQDGTITFYGQREGRYTENEKKSTIGFTIIELLIIIRVIAIPATPSIVAYTGMQPRARESQLRNDVAEITKALGLYYVDIGQSPTAGGSTTISSHWSTKEKIHGVGFDAEAHTLR